MSVKLRTEHNLEFLILKGAAQAPLTICNIVGNHVSWLKYTNACKSVATPISFELDITPVEIILIRTKTKHDSPPRKEELKKIWLH